MPLGKHGHNCTMQLIRFIPTTYRGIHLHRVVEDGSLLFPMAGGEPATIGLIIAATTAAAGVAQTIQGLTSGKGGGGGGVSGAPEPPLGAANADAEAETSARKRQQEQRQLAAAAGGRSSTILTGGLGDVGTVTTQPKTLLGS